MQNTREAFQDEARAPYCRHKMLARPLKMKRGRLRWESWDAVLSSRMVIIWCHWSRRGKCMQIVCGGESYVCGGGAVGGGAQATPGRGVHAGAAQ